MRVCLVYDRVNKSGGAEQILKSLHRLWPQAPLYTAVYNSKTAPWAKNWDVRPSWLNRLPWAKTHHEFYPWLTPLAFESFDFSGYDLVVSVTSAEAKAIITKPGTRHICYCLTPTRYLWSHQKEYLDEPGLGQWLRPLLKYLQRNDLVYSQRPDEYVAISETVRRRIKKYYGRDSQVIYPPVDTEKFHSVTVPQKGDYFLIVSRLVNYKKIDLAIRAFNRLRQPLVIVGRGREEKRLKKMAGQTIKFTGWVDEAKLIAYYQNCRALVMPQEEDFGIAAVEAQAAGRPVIAYGRGGATETVMAGRTGLFFDQPRVDSLTAAVKQFERLKRNQNTIKNYAEKFEQKNFLKQWQRFR